MYATEQEAVNEFNRSAKDFAEVIVNEFNRSAKDFAEVIVKSDNPIHIDLEQAVQTAMDNHTNQQGCKWPDNALKLVKEMPAFITLKSDIKNVTSAVELLSLPSFKEVANSLELIEICQLD